MSFSDLRQRLTRLLVEPFPNQARRELLLDNLFVLLEKIEAEGGASIFSEFWIDGSFVTKKEEPNDIDIVVIHATGIQLSRELVDSDSWYSRYRCDIHYVEFGDRPTKGYYQDCFGSDRDNYPKGIIRIRF